MKYIIFEQNGNEYPVIFPETVVHSTFQYLRPVSAGFCSLSTDETLLLGYRGYKVCKVHVWGESKSLNLQSRTEDAQIIERGQIKV